MQTHEETPTTAEQNEALFRRIIDEGFNQGNLAVADEVLSPQIAEHQAGMGAGPEGLKGAITYLRSVFPDFTLTIEDTVTAGDTIWVRMRARGTQQGPHMGLPPTGKPIDIYVIDICRFEGGKMVEHWGVPDRFALLEQLGLLPRPQAAPA